jgi:hypothetical protein
MPAFATALAAAWRANRSLLTHVPIMPVPQRCGNSSCLVGAKPRAKDCRRCQRSAASIAKMMRAGIFPFPSHFDKQRISLARKRMQLHVLRPSITPLVCVNKMAPNA